MVYIGPYWIIPFFECTSFTILSNEVCNSECGLQLCNSLYLLTYLFVALSSRYQRSRLAPGFVFDLIISSWLLNLSRVMSLNRSVIWCLSHSLLALLFLFTLCWPTWCSRTSDTSFFISSPGYWFLATEWLSPAARSGILQRISPASLGCL